MNEFQKVTNVAWAFATLIAKRCTSIATLLVYRPQSVKFVKKFCTLKTHASRRYVYKNILNGNLQIVLTLKLFSFVQRSNIVSLLSRIRSTRIFERIQLVLSFHFVFYVSVYSLFHGYIDKAQVHCNNDKFEMAERGQCDIDLFYDIALRLTKAAGVVRFIQMVGKYVSNECLF